MAKRRGHGEGSIYQRASDGLWVGSLNLGWVNGKRKRKYVYGKTFEEVRSELSKLGQQRDQGLTVATDRLTVAQFLERWLTEVVDGRVSLRTKESYEGTIRRRIVPVIGKRQLAKLTAVDVNSLMRDREQSGLSPRTVHQVLVVLRMALKQAVQWDLVPRNVATLVSVSPGRPFEATALDDDQIARFLAAARDHRYGPLFSIAVLVGPRVGELQGLRWKDVELDRGQMHIRQALARVGGEYQFTVPKTAKSRRTVALPDLCVDALREHRKAQLATRLLAGGRWQDFDLVFCSSIGTPLNERLLRHEFRGVLQAADIPQIRFHDLRHSAITSMIHKGIPPHVVAAIVGHSTITTTLNTYAKVVGSTMKDAAALMNDAFGGAKSANKVSS